MSTVVSTSSSSTEHSAAHLSRLHWAIFGGSFLAYAFVGWIGAYVLQTYNNDGIARIAKAYAVLYSRDPHLGAIGLVWPPLPVLTDLPLVFLLKPLDLTLVAGPIMSATYAAFAIAQLWEALRHFGLPFPWQLIWTAAFGAHPLIVQNATMGLSEAPFLAFLLLSLNGFLAWEETGRPSGLVWSGIGAALALYCRYEALAWVAVLALAIVWQLRLRSLRLWDSTVMGSIVGFITPPLWALALWAFVNWQIMGNPIHFLIGQGSTATTPDTAQAVGPTHPFAFAYGSLAGAAVLLLRQITDLAPLITVATALLIFHVVWRRRWADLVHLALAWSVLGFVYFIAFRGLLPPFTRYSFWIVPAGVIAASAAYRAAPSGWPRHSVAIATALLLLFPSTWLPFQAWHRLSDPLPQRFAGALLLPPEVTDARQVRGQLEEFRAVADYLNAQQPGTLTLMDGAIAEAVLFFLARPYEVVTSDRDFFDILRSPVGRVDQILVPYPSFDARGRSDVLRLYPHLYENPEPWARLIQEFRGTSAFRLYQVVKNDRPISRQSPNKK